MSSVKQSLDRATSIADVALSAGETISDLLNQLKEKVVAAKDTSLKTQSRQLLDGDFKALLKSIASAVQNANFDGGNLLNGSLPTGLEVPCQRRRQLVRHPVDQEPQPLGLDHQPGSGGQPADPHGRGLCPDQAGHFDHGR